MEWAKSPWFGICMVDMGGGIAMHFCPSAQSYIWGILALVNIAGILCWIWATFFSSSDEKHPNIIITKFDPTNKDIEIKNVGSSYAKAISATRFITLWGPPLWPKSETSLFFEEINILQPEQSEKLIFCADENKKPIKNVSDTMVIANMFKHIGEWKYLNIIYKDQHNNYYVSKFTFRITIDNEVKASISTVDTGRRCYWWERNYWKIMSKLERYRTVKEIDKQGKN